MRWQKRKKSPKLTGTHTYTRRENCFQVDGHLTSKTCTCRKQYGDQYACVSGQTGSSKHERTHARSPLFLPREKKTESECIFKSYNFPNNYYNLYWPNCPKGKLYICYIHGCTSGDRV